MPLRDYRAIDGDDYYGQGFGDQSGKVSVWISLTDDSDVPEGLDVLQDLCGVGYYDHDFQESNGIDWQLVPVRRLLQDISYSDSFVDAVEKAAREKNVAEGRWVLVQFDYVYDPSKVKRAPASDPIFLGVFDYLEDDSDDNFERPRFIAASKNPDTHHLMTDENKIMSGSGKAEEIRQFLETLMGWGFDRPWMYGGSPFATNAVFWQWRMIWAELTERTRRFEEIVEGGEDTDLHKPELAGPAYQTSTDPATYKPVINYWRAVDQQLGIQHPPAS